MTILFPTFILLHLRILLVQFAVKICWTKRRSWLFVCWLAMTAARRVHVAQDHTEGDPRLVSLGLHVDAGSVRLAGSAVRRQARVWLDDVDVIAQHGPRADSCAHAPVPAAVAAFHRRRRISKSIHLQNVVYSHFSRPNRSCIASDSAYSYAFLGSVVCLSVCLSVCRLSHSYNLLDGF